MCISPAVVVRALGPVTVTIGSDPGTANALGAMGGIHTNRTVEECHIDPTNKVVTAPAYMVDSGIAQVAVGIEAAVDAVLEMA